MVRVGRCTCLADSASRGLSCETDALRIGATWRGTVDPWRDVPAMTTGANGQTTRMTAHVTGEVQGVGYRMYARRRAQALGLCGYVTNLADGSVKVVVEGPRDQLSYLLMVLRRGPASARVEDAAATWSAPTGEFSAFSIR